VLKKLINLTIFYQLENALIIKAKKLLFIVNARKIANSFWENWARIKILDFKSTCYVESIFKRHYSKNVSKWGSHFRKN